MDLHIALVPFLKLIVAGLCVSVFLATVLFAVVLCRIWTVKPQPEFDPTWKYEKTLTKEEVKHFNNSRWD